MATRDKGVYPNLYGRKFKAAECQFEDKVMRQENCSVETLDFRRSRVEWSVFRATRERELSALSAMQFARPMKPPGRP